jgi:hypothetical protein
MPRSVYSIRMAEWSGASGTVASFTVPAGFVYVVKTISIVTAVSAAAMTFDLAGTPVWGFTAPTLPSGQFATGLFDGSIVLNAGEVGAVVVAGQCEGQISGYKLSSP